MSTYHVPVKAPHRFFHGPTTRLGWRALKWLAWSFSLLVAVVVAGWVEEGVFGRGHHTGVFYNLFNVAWTLGLFASGGLAMASEFGALVAIVRRGERSWAIFALLMPALLLLLIFLHPLFIND